MVDECYLKVINAVFYFAIAQKQETLIWERHLRFAQIYIKINVNSNVINSNFSFLKQSLIRI